MQSQSRSLPFASLANGLSIALLRARSPRAELLKSHQKRACSDCTWTPRQPHFTLTIANAQFTTFHLGASNTRPGYLSPRVFPASLETFNTDIHYLQPNVKHPTSSTRLYLHDTKHQAALEDAPIPFKRSPAFWDTTSSNSIVDQPQQTIPSPSISENDAMALNITSSQHKMLAAAFQCFEEQPKVGISAL